MWMLLCQPDMDAFEDIISTEDVVEHWGSSEDIPTHWRDVVEGCLKRDPNDRIDLSELVKFWDGARRGLGEGKDI